MRNGSSPPCRTVPLNANAPIRCETAPARGQSGEVRLEEEGSEIQRSRGSLQQHLDVADSSVHLRRRLAVTAARLPRRRVPSPAWSLRSPAEAPRRSCRPRHRGEKTDEALRWYDAIVAEEKSKSGGAPTHDGLELRRGARLSRRGRRGQVSSGASVRGLPLWSSRRTSRMPTKAPTVSAAACSARCGRSCSRSIATTSENELVKDIREKYRNRPRFMEILDKLRAEPSHRRDPEGAAGRVPLRSGRDQLRSWLVL